MSSDYIPVPMQRRVRERARDRCEYCRLSQEYQEATFHIDHVVPRSAQGQTVLDNLALACVSCSLRKGAKMSAVDPQTRREAPLFNPRRDAWQEHFQVTEDGWLAGLTPTGWATIEQLKMNRPVAVRIRREVARRTSR
jgi:5-methylcytosine-specific restriction endonuclease McrA